MARSLSIIAVCVWLVACGASTAEPETPSAESGSEPAHEAPPAPEEPGTAAGEEPPAPEGEPQGRLAFTQCDVENRPQACTREYRPVCAEVDNGVRCITTPCDSTDQKEFANGCTACSDAKTQGYWPVACAELTGPGAP